MTTTTPKCSK